MFRFVIKPLRIEVCLLPVKSAAPVAACVAAVLRATPHTAPLCPSNVPIQSPVSPCRSIGFPSEQQYGTINHKHKTWQWMLQNHYDTEEATVLKCVNLKGIKIWNCNCAQFYLIPLYSICLFKVLCTYSEIVKVVEKWHLMINFRNFSSRYLSTDKSSKD